MADLIKTLDELRGGMLRGGIQFSNCDSGLKKDRITVDQVC